MRKRSRRTRGRFFAASCNRQAATLCQNIAESLSAGFKRTSHRTHRSESNSPTAQRPSSVAANPSNGPGPLCVLGPAQDLCSLHGNLSTAARRPSSPPWSLIRGSSYRLHYFDFFEGKASLSAL